ncbi:hypothetical protein B0H17DRAFT_4884 [Mycena rosella]|uniref:Uncharacterized protein n=1 Tax=Mycena rosella TaxID=1033263 RepID=A0AAD7H2G4_MYCRO|nr:hypothetical protein B0H17DRAFT_4884 [Mycena rosella]
MPAFQTANEFRHPGAFNLNTHADSLGLHSPCLFLLRSLSSVLCIQHAALSRQPCVSGIAFIVIVLEGNSDFVRGSGIRLRCYSLHCAKSVKFYAKSISRKSKKRRFKSNPIACISVACCSYLVGHPRRPLSMHGRLSIHFTTLSEAITPTLFEPTSSTPPERRKESSPVALRVTVSRGTRWTPSAFVGLPPLEETVDTVRLIGWVIYSIN